MNRPHVLIVVLMVALAGGLAASQESGLKVGDLAPAFTLPGSDGLTYSLADYAGVRPVVLAWFPRTPIKD